MDTTSTTEPVAFTEADRAEMRRRGLAPDAVLRQIALLRTGTRHTRLERACTVGDGILRLDDAAVRRHADAFDAAVAAGRVTRFVPASGASTRMWKSLLAVRSGEASKADHDAVERLLSRLVDLAFADDVAAALAARGERLETAGAAAILDAIVGAGALDYAARPKALIPFHRHADGARTPFEEHLVDALALALDSEGRARVHFTVSPEHEERLEALLARARPRFERGGARLEVGFSTQSPATDTIALEASGALARGDGGRLLFRPGGHGALLVNLQALADSRGGDLVFIRNIDNVVPDRLKPLIYLHERALGGLLVELQARAFAWLARLAEGPLAPDDLASAERFVERELGIALAPSLRAATGAAKELAIRRVLDRPMRVCAMVRNTGEAGGGPFWVADRDGGASLQLVESAQIDRADPAQRAIADAATHFNPTDLVCALRRADGQPHALARHVDPATCFVSDKSLLGRPIRVLEWPGLWNGSMADWSTLFVEVPVETFAPVKTVLDLLRPEHLADDRR